MAEQSDRLDRIEASLERLADAQAVTEARMAVFITAMIETRQDINRLYAAWPEHLRSNHGET